MATAIVSDRWEENPQLGKWVSHQRQRQKEGILGADQRTRLDALGFDWGISQSNWEAMFTRLKRHKEHFGHCNVPGTEDPQLSNWVQSQRQRLKRGTLQADQRTRLEAVVVPFFEGNLHAKL